MSLSVEILITVSIDKGLRTTHRNERKKILREREKRPRRNAGILHQSFINVKHFLREKKNEITDNSEFRG